MSDSTRRMPEPLATSYEVLDYDLKMVWLHYKILMDLYGKTELRVELLNAAAPVFFGDLLSLLRADLLLRVTRLTEHPGTRDRESIVLKTLSACFDNYTAAAIGSDYRDTLLEIEATAKLISRVRHKTIAHRDKALALGQTPDPALDLKYSDVKRVLVAAGRALNLVSRHYGGPKVLYGETIPSNQGVPAVIQSLKLAQWARGRIEADPTVLLEMKQGRWWPA